MQVLGLFGLRIGEIVQRRDMVEAIPRVAAMDSDTVPDNKESFL